MYTPTVETQALSILPFAEALVAEATAPCDYDRETWLYVPHEFLPYRYILGTRGKNPLICIGINPSTAVPGDLDNTLKSVERIAAGNGFDSFTMCNVYAQRATDPDAMDAVCNEALHRENMAAFRYVLEGCADTPTVWAAWGTIIEKRPYLFDCLQDMITIGENMVPAGSPPAAVPKQGTPTIPCICGRIAAWTISTPPPTEGSSPENNPFPSGTGGENAVARRKFLLATAFNCASKPAVPVSEGTRTECPPPRRIGAYLQRTDCDFDRWCSSIRPCPY